MNTRLQCVVQTVIEFHNGSLVAASIAIVWCTKDGHNILVMRPIVSLESRSATSSTSDSSTSMTSWCARDTKVRPFLWLKFSEMSCPKVNPAPLGDMPQPQRSSGSDHSKSHMGPS